MFAFYSHVAPNSRATKLQHDLDNNNSNHNNHHSLSYFRGMLDTEYIKQMFDFYCFDQGVISLADRQQCSQYKKGSKPWSK